jgi:hypothetical protein
MKHSHQQPQRTPKHNMLVSSIVLNGKPLGGKEQDIKEENSW